MKKSIWVIAFVAIAVLSSIAFFGYRWQKTPLVSVVMLTYKRADILPKAIDSILAQTFKNFELIILNDGSPDNTREVVKKYSDSRIRYYENKINKGITYSRNRAADLARGKYIMIMDDDDISLPTRMEKQVAFLESHPDITAVAGQITDYWRIPLAHDNIAVFLILYNNFGNSNTMYRHAFVKKHKIRYDETLKASEDWDFWLSILFNGGKFAALPDDVLTRDSYSRKHYGISYEDANTPIRKRIADFFSEKEAQNFDDANACAKLKMIAKKKILSPVYMNALLDANNCR